LTCTFCPAACAEKFFNLVGKCEACLGEATSIGQADTTCSCGSVGFTSNASSTYDYATGCSCATGYVKNTTTQLCDSCAVDYYRAADGKCKKCLNGGSSEGGDNDTCTCSTAGTPPYDKDVVYELTTGCTCATGYAKPDGEPAGECSECLSGYQYAAGFTCTKCVGDQITNSSTATACGCPDTAAYSGQTDITGCGERTGAASQLPAHDDSSMRPLIISLYQVTPRIYVFSPAACAIGHVKGSDNKCSGKHWTDCSTGSMPWQLAACSLLAACWQLAGSLHSHGLHCMCSSETASMLLQSATLRTSTRLATTAPSPACDALVALWLVA
jgi:hypothetical protein